MHEECYVNSSQAYIADQMTQYTLENSTKYKILETLFDASWLR